MSDLLENLQEGDEEEILGRFLTVKSVERHSFLNYYDMEFEGYVGAPRYVIDGSYCNHMNHPFNITGVRKKKRTLADMIDDGSVRVGDCFKGRCDRLFYYICRDPSDNYCSLVSSTLASITGGYIKVRRNKKLTYVPDKRADWAK